MESVLLLLEHKIDLDLCLAIDGSTALHEALHVGDKAIYLKLLKDGANPAVQDPRGNYPYRWAGYSDREKMLKNLVDKELRKPRPPTLQDLLVSGADLSAIRELIAGGADLHKQFDGRMPLAQAARQRRPEAVCLFLELGADPNRGAASEGNVQPPLFWAVYQSDIESLRLLLDSAGDFRAQIFDFWRRRHSLLYFAGALGAVDLLDFLESRAVAYYAE